MAALLVTIIIYCAPTSLQLFQIPGRQILNDFALSLMATAASLLGFVLAASTFLISHLQQSKFTLIRISKSYYQLPEIISSSLWRLFYLTLSSGLILFVDLRIYYYAIIFITFIISWTLLALATSLWIVLKIYSIPVES